MGFFFFKNRERQQMAPKPTRLHGAGCLGCLWVKWRKGVCSVNSTARRGHVLPSPTFIQTRSCGAPTSFNPLQSHVSSDLTWHPPVAQGCRDLSWLQSLDLYTEYLLTEQAHGITNSKIRNHLLCHFFKWLGAVLIRPWNPESRWNHWLCWILIGLRSELNTACN